MIDDESSVLGSRCHEPDEQRAFENGIKRDEREEKPGEKLEDREEGENDPISQPFLRVIWVLATFNGFRRDINGQKKENNMRRRKGESMRGDGMR